MGQDKDLIANDVFLFEGILANDVDTSICIFHNFKFISIHL